MLRKLLLFAAISSVFFGVVSSNTTHALPVVGFQAGRIIDDAVFTSKDSMNVSQIQNFLNSKVSACDTYGTQPSEFGGGTRAQWGTAHGYPPPYTCLKDYSENGIGSAQIIYNIAQKYQINPQVLIVLLQKEQGLVTDTWPLSTQYKTATGYGCPDTAPCDSQYFGLTNQLDWSGKMFRAIMNGSPTWYSPYVVGTNYIQWSPNAACGGSNVDILNRSTAALYDYTPYQPNQAALSNAYGSGDSCSAYGNRNFYSYFNDWFGPSIVGQYMSPLFKGITSNIIYAVVGNTKYPLASPDVMDAYGLSREPVTLVSDDALSTYTTAQTVTTTLAKKQFDSSGTLYLFDDGKRYPVSIGDCMNNLDGSSVSNSTWKIDCFNQGTTNTLPNSLVDNFTTQDINLPNVILNSGSAWKIEQGAKRRITDPAFIDILGGWGKVRWMENINASQPTGNLLIPSNSIVKFSGSDAIYLMTYTKLLPITSLEDYYAWKLDKLPVYSLAADYNTPSPIPVGTPLSSIIQDVNGNYSLISANGTRLRLSPGQTEWPVGSATTNADVYINTLPVGTKSTVYRSSSGNIFVVENGKERIIPTMNDLAGLGFSPNNLTNVTRTAELLVPYDSLKLAPNRLFKVVGSDAIRYTQGASSSLQVNSTSYPGLPYSGLITVDTPTGLQYPITGQYTP
jgi:hypothetical protein